jgi:hypothetical protein
MVTRQLPSVGRIVHYQSYGTPNQEFLSEPRAAIIASVEADGDPWSPCDLVVLNPNGLFFNNACPFSEEPKPGCWSWPPQVGTVEEL